MGIKIKDLTPLAFTDKAKKTGSHWFTVIDDKFVCNINVNKEEKNQLHNAVKELLDLRLLEYSQRESVQQNIAALSNRAGKSQVHHKVNNLVQLAFYPNLKIACGHFKTGDDSHVNYIDAPEGYGRLLADKHFLANATGNSMNGGKHPILDGDLLLLELISPESAGSLQGQTVVIENHDFSGDEQYLLRDVKKLADGRYQLLAKNSDYEPIYADEEMKPLARLKAVII